LIYKVLFSIYNENLNLPTGKVLPNSIINILLMGNLHHNNKIFLANRWF